MACWPLALQPAVAQTAAIPLFPTTTCTCLRLLQGGGVHGNAILSKFNFADVAVVPHRCAGPPGLLTWCVLGRHVYTLQCPVGGSQKVAGAWGAAKPVSQAQSCRPAWASVSFLVPLCCAL